MYRVCDFCVAGACPGIVSQSDNVVVVFLQQEGEVIRDVGQEVVVSSEGAVQLEPQQLGPDGGDQVVGEGEAGDLQVVLTH